jgi:hypothetical protein
VGKKGEEENSNSLPIIDFTYIYFPCIRVAPLCAFLLNLKLLIKKKKDFTYIFLILNFHLNWGYHMFGTLCTS